MRDLQSLAGKPTELGNSLDTRCQKFTEKNPGIDVTKLVNSLLWKTVRTAILAGAAAAEK